MKFRDYVDRWKKHARSKLSDSYKLDQNRMLDLHILPILGDKNLQKISPSDISDTLEASEAKGHSKNTQLYIYTLIKKLFDDAIEFFEIPLKNPVKRKYHRPKAGKKKAKFMHPEQSLIVFEYVLGTIFSNLVWIQLLTGLRVGEVLVLKWKHVDFKKRMIYVQGAYIRKNKSYQDYTKNGDQVYVPMPDRLTEYLRSRQGSPNEYISPNTKGAMICYYIYRRYLRKISKRLNLSIRSSHGLRHSCTELYVEQGASTEDLRRLLNHKSSESTENYIHRTDDRLFSLSKNVGQALKSGCENRKKKIAS